MSDYNQAYHNEIEANARRSAETVIGFLMRLFHPQSVIDVGCGRGTWLAEWQRQGITDFLGIDGGGQDPTRLLIPPDRFLEYNLNQPFPASKRYDLVTCLEVVEHLKPASADTIVQTLTGLSDIIVFSAAIPRQGGFQHINEQWPAYWAEKFEAAGYVFTDGIRWQLMPHKEVAWWYRQNLFLVIKKELYEAQYGFLPRFSPDYYVMHKLVYKTYASWSYRLYFTIEQFIYNHFHSLYHAIYPTIKKILAKS
ncbi:methyltransferase domain-containing protein [Larkinella arboricola]